MDVVCVGNLVFDAVSSPLDAPPAAGQLKLMERYLLSVGGCAANTAVGLRRLGRSVRVAGKLGQDVFGDFVLRNLECTGVDTSGIARSAAGQTSATFIVNVRGEDRRFVHCIGTGGDFTVSDLKDGVLEGARVLYVGGYLAMPSFEADQVVELFRRAKESGVMTVLDVVIAAEAKVSLADVAPVLPVTDYFLPNDDEARLLTGLGDPRAQAEALSRLAPDCTVVITLGSRGLIARRGVRVWEAGTYKLESIDQSGAGDAFDAGLIAGLLEGWPLEQTLRFASAVGASATRALGCTPGVFTRDEALEFIARNELVVRETSGGETNIS